VFCDFLIYGETTERHNQLLLSLYCLYTLRITKTEVSYIKYIKGEKERDVAMNTTDFISQNQKKIDEHIRAVVPTADIDDAERELWVLNDEGLYLWAKSEGVDI